MQTADLTTTKISRKLPPHELNARRTRKRNLIPHQPQPPTKIPPPTTPKPS